MISFLVIISIVFIAFWKKLGVVIVFFCIFIITIVYVIICISNNSFIFGLSSCVGALKVLRL